jgi:hypothetical protein
MLILTAVGVLATTAGVYIAYLTYVQGEEPGSDERIAAPSVPALSSTSQGTRSATATAVAVVCGSPNTGAAVDCHDANASFRLSQPACAAKSVLPLWRLDPELDALDLVFTDKGDVCWVKPGNVATRAGASAADLVKAAGGSVNDALRECAAGRDVVPIACSQAHQIEWMGEWTASDTVAPSDSCQRKATDYTRMTMSGTENRLVAESAERTADGVNQTRCLVRVEGIVLDGTLRNLRNGQLPQAP